MSQIAISDLLNDMKAGYSDDILMKRYHINEKTLRKTYRELLMLEWQSSSTMRHISTAKTAHINEMFHSVSHSIAQAVGSPWSFIIAAILILTWGLTGPIFNYSDTWQLIVNTATTIVTFLMVFLIQNTQNRNDKATQLKLDELVRAIEGARTELVDLETRGDDELKELEDEFKNLGKQEKVVQKLEVK
jgi:low affinity Fe/Cu permease